MKKEKEKRTERVYIAMTPTEKKIIYANLGNSAVMRYILLKTKKPNLVN